MAAPAAPCPREPNEKDMEIKEQYLEDIKNETFSHRFYMRGIIKVVRDESIEIPELTDEEFKYAQLNMDAPNYEEIEFEQKIYNKIAKALKARYREVLLNDSTNLTTKQVDVTKLKTKIWYRPKNGSRSSAILNGAYKGTLRLLGLRTNATVIEGLT